MSPPDSPPIPISLGSARDLIFARLTWGQRYIWTVGAGLGFFILLAAGYAACDLRSSALKNTSNDLKNLSFVLADQTTRYVQVLDLMLTRLQARSTSLGIDSPEDFAVRMGDEETHRFLHINPFGQVKAHEIGIFDAAGWMINRVTEGTGPPFSIADRAYFAAVRDNPDSSIVIGDPAISRSSNNLSLFFARRISAPDGTFLGAAVAVIDVTDLLEFYRTISTAVGVRVTLLRRDGMVLARYPKTSSIGKMMPPGTIWYRVLADGGGVYISAGAFDPEDLIIAVRPSQIYPLVVDAVMNQDLALVNWRQEAVYLVSAAVLLATVCVIFFWSIGRQFRLHDEQHTILSLQTEALRRSERRLLDFAELASDWFWEQDADDRFVDTATLSPFRLSSDRSFIGKRRWEITDTTREPEKWAEHRRTVAARQAYRDFQFEHVDGTGRIRHLSISGRPLFCPEGRFLGYRGIGHDKTAAVLAQRELEDAKERAEQAEAMFQDAIDSMSEGFVVFDATGRLVASNEVYRQKHKASIGPLSPGTTFEQILRDSVERKFFPDAVGHEEKWIEWRLSRFSAANETWEQENAGGEWALVSERRMRNGGVAGLRVDITALKQTQAALRNSEARLEKAQEIAKIGSWEREAGAEEYTWSKQLFHILGLPPTFKPMRGALNTLVQPSDRPLISQWAKALRAGVESRAVEFQAVRPDGQVLVLRLDGRTDVEADGSVGRLSGTVQDITNLKMIEQRLAQAQKMEAIGNLTGGMAHDFNNMLGIVTGNLELASRELPKDSDVAELCDEALEGATRCAELVKRLLAFARRQSLNPELIDVNALVSNVVRSLRRTISDNIAITFSSTENLTRVIVDPVQLESAIINLANNARDAMPHGGRINITIKDVYMDSSATEFNLDIGSGYYTIIQINDTGSGIPPDIISRIFDPFFTTKERSYGTGLGLSMAFGFIKQSGGQITVYSEVGLGTTFQIYLPSNSDQIVAKLTSMVTDAIRGGRETILVVEDQRQLRRAAMQTLVELGYHVLEADGPEAALAVLAGDTHVDLLFTDIVMPGGLHGLGLANQAITMHPGLCVLLTSGFSGSHQLQSNTGIYPFPLLTKPYFRDQLARTIREILDGTRNEASKRGDEFSP